MPVMDIWHAQRLAGELMRAHGLQSWSFTFNRRRCAMGICNYTHKRIELSLPYVARNDEASVRDTILHEIAHALAGRRAGHGPKWQAICRRLGATPERCGEAVMPEGRWRAVCPGCQRTFTRHRRPRRGASYWCRPCGREKGELQFALGASLRQPKPSPAAAVHLPLGCTRLSTTVPAPQ